MKEPRHPHYSCNIFRARITSVLGDKDFLQQLVLLRAEVF